MVFYCQSLSFKPLIASACRNQSNDETSQMIHIEGHLIGFPTVGTLVLACINADNGINFTFSWKHVFHMQ